MEWNKYLEVYIKSMSLANKTELIEIIRKCMDTKEIDKRTLLLQYLNGHLPSEYKVQFPSFITNDWINYSLYMLEEKFL